jgi:hypothetical protein
LPVIDLRLDLWYLLWLTANDRQQILRHTGNTLAATAGATQRELMDRMGHDSERAAMIYLRGSNARQHQIADTLSKLTRDELRRAGQRTGTQRARNRKRAS